VVAGLDPRGVYLRPLVGGGLAARASRGARLRAGYLQAFLAPLQRSAERRLALHGHVELWVVGAEDWPHLTSAPYGWPLTRLRPTAAAAALAGGPVATLLVAAQVPGRLLRRFEPLLLAAARSGVAVPPAEAGGRGPVPGALVEGPPVARAEARELVDLVMGHEWGHACVRLGGLRTGVRWIDELLAIAVFLAALRETEAVEPLRRLLAWSEVQVAAGAGPAPRGPGRPEAAARPAASGRDLVGFELPRARQRLPELLWRQGVLTQRAWDLVGSDGWDFVERFRAELERTTGGAGIRDDAPEVLARVDPGFAAWWAAVGGGGDA
jgi:hypothetical protein